MGYINPKCYDKVIHRTPKDKPTECARGVTRRMTVYAIDKAKQGHQVLFLLELDFLEIIAPGILKDVGTESVYLGAAETKEQIKEKTQKFLKGDKALVLVDHSLADKVGMSFEYSDFFEGYLKDIEHNCSDYIQGDRCKICGNYSERYLATIESMRKERII